MWDRSRGLYAGCRRLWDIQYVPLTTRRHEVRLKSNRFRRSQKQLKASGQEIGAKILLFREKDIFLTENHIFLEESW